MGKLKNLLIDTAEDEAFNEIERQAKQRKEAVLQALHDENERLGLYKPDEHLHLMDELAIARVCIRELGDRLSRLEKPWVGLHTTTILDIYAETLKEHRGGSMPDGQIAFAKAIEQALKEKNYA